MEKLAALIKAVPKAEIHSHLDGCLRMETVAKLAKEHGVVLPTYDPEALSKLLLKDKYENLVDYLKPFGVFVSVMKKAEQVEQISYEYACDYIKDNVFYVETRFAPQLHVGAHLKTIEDVLVAVNAGMSRAANEYNRTPEVVNKEKPEFRYGIICCIMRAIFPGMSEYYDEILNAFKYTANKKLAHVHAGKQLIQAALIAKEKLHIPIVALDLAGGEFENPCSDFAEPFEIAKLNLLNITIHAGEADGPDSIYNALMMGAQRLGHALHLWDKDMTKRPNAESFCNSLAEYIAKTRIGVEVNITSNMQTYAAIKTVADHPLKKMLDNKICACICCDNKTVSKTWISKELQLAVDGFKLSLPEIKSLVLNSFEQAFFPGTQTEKLEYIATIKKYYDSIEAKYAPK